MRVVFAILLPLLVNTPVAVEEIGVTGYVLTLEGTPVSSGTVIADNGRSTAAIDGTGHFRLVPTRSGLQQVLVSVPALAPYRFTLTVPASRTLRLPVIHLGPASYFRARFVSAGGEVIAAPQLRHRSFDVSGNPMFDAVDDRIATATDADGVTSVGPLSRGIMTLAVDSPFFAQTRLPDVAFDGAPKDIDGGTIVIQQPGAVLHVDVLDGRGQAVTSHDVYLEDVLPRSPLVFRPVQTDQHGRATFDRLAAGRYRVWTTGVERCGVNQVYMAAARVLAMSGRGEVDAQLVVGTRARFRIASPLGPMRGILVSASPTAQPSPPPFMFRASPSGCRGTTDADGRVTLMNFPPGLARLEVPMANSKYVRQVEVLADGPEQPIVIPDGFLPVRVVNALKHQPVPGASITWTGGGARIEAIAMVTGEALLEGVGTEGGALAVTARGFEPAEEQLAEPPGIPHDIALTPVTAVPALRPRVITVSGEPLSNALLQLIVANPAAVPHVAVTDAKGVVAFSDVPSGSLQLLASADGFVTSTMRVGEDRTAEIVFTLMRGYRVIAAVELAAAEGAQAVRVVNDAGASMDGFLDSASDRSVQPSARVSLGPLAPGNYVIELSGAGGRREERVRIVDSDVQVMFR